LFALEYTLVPEAVYPTQLQQALAGYEHVLSIIKDPSKVCLAGDSAGGSLMLSLLLYVASKDDWESKRPGFATLISPWTTLVSSKDRNTSSDFLETTNLHQYAWNYAGSKAALEDPLVSPGTCTDREWWSRAIPLRGLLLLLGSEEVLAPAVYEWFDLVKQTRRPDEMELLVEEGGIHAWPLVELFMSDTKEQRRKGLDKIATIMWRRMGSHRSKEWMMKQ
jgi:acetyl esterase/lipase